MAVISSNTAATSARAAGGSTKRILGYLNIALPTANGADKRRLDSIRLYEGNELHEQVFAGLNATRDGDDKLLKGKAPEEREALMRQRLENLQKILHISFNPSRTEAENELVLF